MTERDDAGLDAATTAYLPAIDASGELVPPQPAATPAATIEALPASSALLVVAHGPTTGARFLLDADVTTAGRDTHSEIFLDDVTVSRRHAEFRRSGEDFEVRDVGSLNGTYVNRVRIESAVLATGDEVQIGKFRMTFYPSPHRAEGSA